MVRHSASRLLVSRAPNPMNSTIFLHSARKKARAVMMMIFFYDAFSDFFCLLLLKFIQYSNFFNEIKHVRLALHNVRLELFDRH